MKYFLFLISVLIFIISKVNCKGVGAARLLCYVNGPPKDDIDKCTHIIYAGNYTDDSYEVHLNEYRKVNSNGKIILSVDTINSELLRPLLKSKTIQGLEVYDAHRTLNGSKVLELIQNAKSVLQSVGGGPLFVSIPANPELLAKYYDLKRILKLCDLLIAQTHELGAISNMTYHTSRLSGLWDMMNTDSVVDLIIGLGVPASKIVITLPATALKFELANSTLSTPGSPTLFDEPEVLGQDELCELLSSDGGMWTLERDQDLSAPYAFRKSDWISFEDLTSVDVKGKYVRVRGLAGLALADTLYDNATHCGMSLLQALDKVLNTQSRAPRGAVLRSLEHEILTPTPGLSFLEELQVSPYRITQVVDSDGIIHSIREDTRTEFTCTRQGYFVHPRSCGRFYRCVKFDQLSPDYTVFEFDCPAGLAFDSRWEVCVWPGSLSEGSACPGSAEIAPVPQTRFQCPDQEGYYADPENCRWFFACLNHGPEISAYEFRCPFGLGFDPQRLICDWPWLVPNCGKIGRYEAETFGFTDGTLSGATGFDGQTPNAINVAGHNSLASGAALDNLVGIQNGVLSNPFIDDALNANLYSGTSEFPEPPIESGSILKNAVREPSKNIALPVDDAQVPIITPITEVYHSDIHAPLNPTASPDNLDDYKIGNLNGGIVKQYNPYKQSENYYDLNKQHQLIQHSTSGQYKQASFDYGANNQYIDEAIIGNEYDVNNQFIDAKFTAGHTQTYVTDSNIFGAIMSAGAINAGLVGKTKMINTVELDNRNPYSQDSREAHKISVLTQGSPPQQNGVTITHSGSSNDFDSGLIAASVNTVAPNYVATTPATVTYSTASPVTFNTEIPASYSTPQSHVAEIFGYSKQLNNHVTPTSARKEKIIQPTEPFNLNAAQENINDSYNYDKPEFYGYDYPKPKIAFEEIIQKKVAYTTTEPEYKHAVQYTPQVYAQDVSLSAPKQFQYNPGVSYSLTPAKQYDQNELAYQIPDEKSNFYQSNIYNYESNHNLNKQVQSVPLAPTQQIIGNIANVGVSQHQIDYQQPVSLRTNPLINYTQPKEIQYTPIIYNYPNESFIQQQVRYQHEQAPINQFVPQQTYEQHPQLVYQQQNIQSYSSIKVPITSEEVNRQTIVQACQYESNKNKIQQSYTYNGPSNVYQTNYKYEQPQKQLTYSIPQSTDYNLPTPQVTVQFEKQNIAYTPIRQTIQTTPITKEYEENNYKYEQPKDQLTYSVHDTLDYQIPAQNAHYAPIQQNIKAITPQIIERFETKQNEAYTPIQSSVQTTPITKEYEENNYKYDQHKDQLTYLIPETLNYQTPAQNTPFAPLRQNIKAPTPQVIAQFEKQNIAYTPIQQSVQTTPVPETYEENNYKYEQPKNQLIYSVPESQVPVQNIAYTPIPQNIKETPPQVTVQFEKQNLAYAPTEQTVQTTPITKSYESNNFKYEQPKKNYNYNIQLQEQKQDIPPTPQYVEQNIVNTPRVTVQGGNFIYQANIRETIPTSAITYNYEQPVYNYEIPEKIEQYQTTAAPITFKQKQYTQVKAYEQELINNEYNKQVYVSNQPTQVVYEESYKYEPPKPKNNYISKYEEPTTSRITASTETPFDGYEYSPPTTKKVVFGGYEYSTPTTKAVKLDGYEYSTPTIKTSEPTYLPPVEQTTYIRPQTKDYLPPTKVSSDYLPPQVTVTYKPTIVIKPKTTTRVYTTSPKPSTITTTYRAPDYLPPNEDYSEVHYKEFGLRNKAKIKVYTDYDNYENLNSTTPIWSTTKKYSSQVFETVGPEAGLVSSTTASSGFSPVVKQTEPEAEVNLQITQRPVRLRQKQKLAVVTKINDFDPILVRKLGATCSCQQPIVVLRGTKSNNNEYTDYDDYPNDYDSQNIGKIINESNREQITPSSTFNPIIVPDDSYYQDYADDVVSISSTTKPFISTPDSKNINIKIRAKSVSVNPTVVLKERNRGDSSNQIGNVDVKFNGRAGGWRNRDETLQSSIDCQRAGLFRHPKNCNKFYACRWDDKKDRFTLDVFNCPIKLNFDPNLGACNWPSQGPACESNTLLTPGM